MASLTSSPKADVRFRTAAPRELGYAVLYQSCVAALMLQHAVSSKWQGGTGGTCVEHISLVVILSGPSLLTASI